MSQSHDPLERERADRAEFFALYSLHTRQIYGYLRTLIPNQADAEDVFQETSAILWEKFDTFRPGSDFRAWAYRITYFRALNFRSRQRRQPIVFSDAFYETVDRETQAMQGRLDAQHRALADCYARLGPADREVIDSRYRLGASVQQVAAKFDKSLRSVYRTLDRIHATLLHCIEHKLEEEEQL